MTMQLVTELAIVSLLFATCGYCFLLSRRLRVLRESQQEMIALIEKFDKATGQAEKNLAAMQANSAIMSRKLTRLTQRAAGLSDELSVMVETGDNIASRIEAAADAARAIRSAGYSDKGAA